MSISPQTVRPWKLILAESGLALGLFVNGAEVRAQEIVIQQPVISRVGAATTVSVPAGGTALIGGVGRSTSGSRRSLGVPPNRSFGRSTESSQISVHVTVHDFEALDRQALAIAEQEARAAEAQAAATPPAAPVGARNRQQPANSARPPVRSAGRREPITHSRSTTTALPSAGSSAELSPAAERALAALERRAASQTLRQP